MGAPTSITHSSVADPCIAVDENGGAVLAYVSCVSKWGGWAQTCTPGGGWSAAAVQDDDRPFERALAVGSDGAGNAVVAWKKQVITSASGGCFCDTVHGSRCSDPLSYMSLAVSPTTGHAILLWAETIDNGPPCSRPACPEPQHQRRAVHASTNSPLRVVLRVAATGMHWAARATGEPVEPHGGLA